MTIPIPDKCVALMCRVSNMSNGASTYQLSISILPTNLILVKTMTVFLFQNSFRNTVQCTCTHPTVVHPWDLPVTDKRLAQDRVVSFLGDVAVSGSMEGGQVPAHQLYHSVLWALHVHNSTSKLTTLLHIQKPWNTQCYYIILHNISSLSFFSSLPVRPGETMYSFYHDLSVILSPFRVPDFFLLLFGKVISNFLWNFIAYIIILDMKSAYLTNRSGWAKKSAYISSRDRRSRIKVGRTTLVRSMPILTWDNRCAMILPCFSSDPTVIVIQHTINSVTVCIIV